MLDKVSISIPKDGEDYRACRGVPLTHPLLDVSTELKVDYSGITDLCTFHEFKVSEK